MFKYITVQAPCSHHTTSKREDTDCVDLSHYHYTRWLNLLFILVAEAQKAVVL